MKKLLLFAFAGLCLCGIVGCEDVYENPGDFSLKATLGFSPASALSKVDGITYDFKVLREMDTAFVSSYTKNDTAFDASGQPLIGPDGQLMITVDTIYFKTGKVAHYYEMDTITLPSYADTFTVHITSNALWKAPQFKPKKTSEDRRHFTLRRGRRLLLFPYTPQQEQVAFRKGGTVHLYF